MTKLTIDQALQKGVAAHKAGQVQEADRLYTAILKAQPKHPDANHNMGVLAVGVGKVEQALPFFKTALEANPVTGQYYLSYIDTLIKLDKLADAKAVLDQAKSKGAKGDGFDKLEQRLKEEGQEPQQAKQIASEPQPKQPNILDTLKLDQALKLAKKKAREGAPEEAEYIYQDILTKFPKNKRARDGLKGPVGTPVGKASNGQNPPPDQLKSLINTYNQGQHTEVLNQTKALIKQYPQSISLLNLQGAVLRMLGQLDLSVDAYKKALIINPSFAPLYINLGVSLKIQGKRHEAIEAYEKAITLDKNYAEAHYNKGIALQEQGNLKEAIQAYNMALSIEPDHASASHMLSSLTGVKNDTAPKRHVEKLFDGYAREFNTRLVDDLGYRIPQLVTNLLVRLHGGGSLGSILDMGCGTGLLGQGLRENCSHIEGIDLSNEMLKHAEKLSVYQKLSQRDISEYLSEANLDFDYFIALDTFIYIGDLTDIFSLIKERNQRSGRLVFSTETTQLDGFHLEETGRYAHSRNYIESLCSEFGYVVSNFSTSKLRKQNESYLSADIYVLDF